MTEGQISANPNPNPAQQTGTNQSNQQEIKKIESRSEPSVRNHLIHRNQPGKERRGIIHSRNPALAVGRSYKQHPRIRGRAHTYQPRDDKRRHRPDLRIDGGRSSETTAPGCKRGRGERRNRERVLG
uniref:Uncharacterized protein n=1 Tax=Triticum urartu TaxID=4572 RepID=A0A8R7U3N4_TRIUA